MKIQKNQPSNPHAYLGSKPSLLDKQIQKISRNCIKPSKSTSASKLANHKITHGLVEQPKGRGKQKRA